MLARAAVLDNPEAKFAVRDVELREPGPGEVLVAVHRVAPLSFSRTQRSVISKPADTDPPGSNYQVPQSIPTILRRGET